MADPRYAPLPTFPLLRSRLGAITAWLSYNTGWDNLTSEQSGVLSLIAAMGWNTGLSFKHMSVIYRSVFHRRAVQGLRNACSVLPGLSACRLCLLFTGLSLTHTCTLMHSQMHTCKPPQHTHTYAQTHTWRQAALLHYTPPPPPDDYPTSPIITHVSDGPLENLRSSTVKSKNTANFTAVVVVVLMMMMMTTPLWSHFFSFPNSSSQASSWPNKAAS